MHHLPSFPGAEACAADASDWSGALAPAYAHSGARCLQPPILASRTNSHGAYSSPRPSASPATVSARSSASASRRRHVPAPPPAWRHPEAAITHPSRCDAPRPDGHGVCADLALGAAAGGAVVGRPAIAQADARNERLAEVRAKQTARAPHRRVDCRQLRRAPLLITDKSGRTAHPGSRSRCRRSRSPRTRIPPCHTRPPQIGTASTWSQVVGWHHPSAAQSPSSAQSGHAPQSCGQVRHVSHPLHTPSPHCTHSPR